MANKELIKVRKEDEILSGSGNNMLVQSVSCPCLMVDFYLLFTDNELLYRTRDGDVVKLNVDTKERTVIVPNQLFVSVILLTV